MCVFFGSHLRRDSFRIREYDVRLQSNVVADTNTSWTSPEMETDKSTREQERIAGILRRDAMLVCFL